jgi:hypothetical protein
LIGAESDVFIIVHRVALVIIFQIWREGFFPGSWRRSGFFFASEHAKHHQNGYKKQFFHKSMVVFVQT